MSLRLRILALISLVAVTAIGATAYLAFTQASQQATDTVAADKQTTTDIVDELVDYAHTHGTWEGVATRVRELGRLTGQRIKLVTEWDEVIVDTDTLDGRTARAVPAPAVLADPRPSFLLPAGADGKKAMDLTLDAIQRYRAGVRFAACMTRRGLEVTVLAGEDGVPSYLSVTRGDELSAMRLCEAESVTTIEQTGDNQLVEPCVAQPSQPQSLKRELGNDTRPAALVDCLQKAFTARVVDVAPVPMRVYLGVAGDPGPSLAPGPVIAAAIMIALLAIAGTAVISERVLRPVSTLMAAAQRLGEGDLSSRVPDHGQEELARLARSFNRMAESLQRGEERQRRLVADVAHELRTPLANLRGYLEALKDGVLPASPELFASLHEEAVLQQRIVDDLQDLALAEAGALTYHRSAIDLAELVETCRTAHQAAADTAGVALLVRADSPVIAYADPDRLRQVIGNLVSNALRATPSGGWVTLSASGADGQAVVAVRDTGVGVAAEDLPHIFDRFWRADAARGRTTGGIGLGLAIARQIVTDHGGQITVQSEPGAGTTVTVSLPLSPSP